MKKKTAVIVISYMSAAVLVLAILAGIGFQKAEAYKRSVDNNYQHSFDELVTAMSEVDAALQKSVYATSPSMVSAVCTEIFGKAMTAQMSMGSLPFSIQELERTSAFISRVGDYAFSLSRNASRGKGYTEEQLQNLKALSDTASILAQNLKNLQTDMFDGVLSMDELLDSEKRLDEAENSGEIPATIGNSMRLIEKEFPETPSLIYDGPFSEHISDSSPKALEGLDQVDENTARRVAASFTGISDAKMGLTGQSEGSIPCYYFSSGSAGGEISVEVTKQGGRVINMLSSRPVKESRIKIENALTTADKFLASHGYANMAQTYYMSQGNILTINYAYKQDGVVCYSDLVKVSVALDTGSICGFEARGYLSSHFKRDMPQAAVSEDKARELVSADLQVLSHQLTLVPTNGGDEILCHEFKCSAPDERHYIIYVNALSGEQEKILILLEDENGALTL